MPVHLELTKSPEGVTVHIDDNEWAKEHLPINGFTFAKNSIGTGYHTFSEDKLQAAFDSMIETLDNWPRFSAKQEGDTIKVTIPDNAMIGIVRMAIHNAFPLGTESLTTSFQACRYLDSNEFNGLNEVQDEKFLGEFDKLVKSKELPLIKEKYGEKGHELLRRLPALELAELIEKLEKSHVLSQNQIQDLMLGNWSAVSKMVPESVFKTYLEGNIDVNTLATYQLFAACLSKCGTLDKSEWCFKLANDNGELNQEALSRLIQGLNGVLDPEELENFIHEIKTLKPEESFFFSYPLLNFSSNKDVLIERMENETDQKAMRGQVTDRYDSVLVCDFFYHMVDFKVNIKENDDGTTALNVLPPKLQEALYRAKFKENAIHPNYVLGESRGADFEFANQRDVILPSAYNPSKHADGYRADPIEFYYHDFTYHFFTEGANPHRGAYVEIAKMFKADKKIKLWALLGDRDFGTYSSVAQNRFDISKKQLSIAKDLNKDELFWFALATIKSARVDSIIDTGAATMTELNQTVFSPMAMDYIEKNKEAWKEKYGISLEGLQSLTEKMSKIEKLPEDSETAIAYNVFNDGLRKTAEHFLDLAKK